jgi:hypothetical protein
MLSRQFSHRRGAAPHHARGYALGIELGKFVGSSRAIWFGIFVGSAIGGLVPELWGGGAFSYSSVLLSGIGGIAGLWIGLKLGN